MLRRLVHWLGVEEPRVVGRERGMAPTVVMLLVGLVVVAMVGCIKVPLRSRGMMGGLVVVC